MRVVLDTNIVVSALLWRGTPYRLLQVIRQQEHVQMFASSALLMELGEVLIRPAAAKRLAFIGRTALAVLADYIDAVELATPLAVPRVVASDRDDDQIIAAAVAAEADLLVSGDRHLLALGSHRGIFIVNAAAALARIAV